MSTLQHVDVPHSKQPAEAPTTEYLWGDWTTKRSGRLFFFEIFSEVRAQKVSSKW